MAGRATVSRVRDLISRPYALVGVTVISSLVGLAVIAAAGWLSPTFVLETLAYPALVFVVLRARRRDQWSCTPRLLWAFMGLWGLFIVGQFIGGGRHTFPFVRYAMYTDRADAPSALRLELIGDGGTVHRPDLRRVFRPLSPNRQMSRLRHVVQGYERDPLDDERLSSMLEVIARQEERRTGRRYDEARLIRLTLGGDGAVVEHTILEADVRSPS